MLKCPECGHVGHNAASEELDAVGGAQCEDCGYTGFGEDFEAAEEGDYSQE